MEPQKSKSMYYTVAGVLIVLGAFLIFSNKKTEPKMEVDSTVQQGMPVPTTTGAPVVEKIVTETAPAGMPTIAYRNDGFFPPTIEVAAGTKVRFVNESSNEMWVASAMHPTHQLLPGFDQMKGGPKGGVYEYTFTKAGAWKFHDHLKPEFRGSVTVK